VLVSTGSGTEPPLADRRARVSTDWVAFLALLAVAYVVPGPDFVLVLSWATRRRRDGVLAGLGAQTGLSAHVLACVCGVSAAVRHWPWTITVIQVSGALYLVWLGIQTARHTAPPDQEDRGHRGAFLQGLGTNLLNPKAIVFVSSVLPQFADGTWPLPAQLAVLGVLDVGFGLLVWAALVVVGARLGHWLGNPHVRKAWQRTNGVVLIAIGALLAFAHVG
jgi:threonine/homoserine/homoserine lactone efflux protein